MIITITGLPGAGKSTIAKMLSDKLHIPWYSMGDLRGRLAKERGMTIDEFNTLGEQNDATDKEVDAYHDKLEQEHKDLIVEGRMSWHFLPDSLKIFLDINDEDGAKRIFASSKDGLRQDENPYATIEETKQAISARLASDKKRYKMYYNVDYLDRSNYDIVIDTSDKTPDEILAIIFKWLDEKS